jgi:3-hydroxypropionyl-coenzyme A dehydratase
MDADIDTGLRLEIYGWELCFDHEDRQKNDVCIFE